MRSNEKEKIYLFLLAKNKIDHYADGGSVGIFIVFSPFFFLKTSINPFSSGFPFLFSFPYSFFMSF